MEASAPGYITTNFSATVKIKSVEEDDPSDALVVGKYFKATLSALGYEVPTNGMSYTVKAYGLPAGLKLKHNAAWKNKKGKVIVKVKSEWWIEGVPTAAIDYITNPAYLVITANGKTETMPLRLEVEALPAWAKGTFNGNVEWRMENGESGEESGGSSSPATESGGSRPVATAGLATITVSAAGKISGKFSELGTNWTFTAASYTDGRARSRRCLRTLRVRLAPNLPSEAKLLRCMSGPQSQASGSQSSVDGGRLGEAALPGAGADGLTYFAALSLKVTSAGAVTATLSYDTGKTKKDPKTKKTTKVIYKPTCATVVIPTTAADAYQFLSGAYLFFAPSAANNFPGVGGWVQVTERDKVQLWEGGPYWATTNIGAERPEDYGLYFWWGDTTGHRPSSSGTFDFDFSYNNPAIYTYGKGDSQLKSEGWLTDDDALAPAHDAATVHWGGSWRMPMEQELRGLVDNCNWSPATVNGVDGYIVSGRDDYDSASIFLPCAGGGNGTSLNYAGSYGLYWSSVPVSYYDYYAWCLYFSSSSHTTDYSSRDYGQSVRPVQGFTE